MGEGMKVKKNVLIKGELLESYPQFNSCLIRIGDETVMAPEDLVEPYKELEQSYEAIRRVLNPKHEKQITDDDLIEIFGTVFRNEITAENEPIELAKKLEAWDKRIEKLKTIKVGDILEEDATKAEVCITMIIDGRMFHGFEINTGLPRVKNDMLKFNKTGKCMVVRYNKEKLDGQ